MGALSGADASEYVIRRYEGRDLAAVLDLHRAALEPTGAYLGPGRWDADLADVEATYLENGGEFLVAERGGRLVAMGALRILERDRRRGQIRRMRVAPAFQGRGLGRTLLAALERHARAAGVRTLELDTTTGQVRALALYRSAGYRETGRRTLRGLEIVFMEKDIEPPPSA